MLSAAFAGSSSQAQEQAPPGTRLLFDGTTVPVQAGRLFDPSEVLVQLTPGASVQDLIQSYIDGDGPAVRPTVRKLTADGSIVTLVFDSDTGGQGTEDLVNGMMLDNDPRTAALPGSKLLRSLRNSPNVIAASRNYIFSTAQTDINDAISDGGSTADSVNDIIGGGDGGTVSASEPEAPGQPVFPNDSNYKFQWHLKLNGPGHGDTTSPGASNFPVMWGQTLGSDKIVVAVVDTGIVAQHPDIDFARSILPGYDFVSEALEFADDGAVGYDPDPTEPQPSAITTPCPSGRDSGWHGTHVAGIAGAATSNNTNGIAGGAWNIKILPVRALSKCNQGSLRDIALGIYWAAGFELEGIPVNPNPADIINLSLGGLGPAGCDPFYQQAIDAVTAEGVTVVVAAGNSGSSASLFIPASCKNVITVAASDARGHMTNYSNFGDVVDILAPGGDSARDDNGDGQPDGILSTIDGDFTYYNGTSMAAPLVSAAAALLKSQDPSLTPGQIRTLLKQNAIKRSDTECPKSCGAGLLNMAFQN